MDVQNIRNAQYWLARLMFTRHFDMGDWIGPANRVTSLCLAGIASALSFQSETLQPSIDNLSSEYTVYRRKLFSVLDSPNNAAIKVRALSFFGIDNSEHSFPSLDEPDTIFFYTKWPQGLQIIYTLDVDNAIAILNKDSLHHFVLSRPDLPDSFFETLAGYLGLECLIKHGPLWSQPTRHWEAADFVSRNPEAVNGFIAIAQQLLNQKA
jgi:hypothetical protein